MKATIHLVLFCAITTIAVFRVHAQVPVLNSYPLASATLYLDFDGQYVTGTSWNWGGPILAEPASISSETIVEVFNRVSEDYRPFNINVTTDSTVFLAAPYNRRTRVIITTSWQWYGKSGGVAFVGTFSSGDDTPAWVFSDLLGYQPKFIAEACSHEAGHTLGLQHQSVYSDSCSKISDYHEGQGEGEIGWAPIMGISYYKNNTTWHKGATPGGCQEIQDDLDVIAKAANIGFRTDDHADLFSGASMIDIPGFDFLINGLINQAHDADAFRLELQTPANIRLKAIPQHVSYGNEGANIDIEVAILNAAQDTIGIYNPSDFLDVVIDTNLNSGDYYIIVKPSGNINHSEYGSLGYYSLNGQLAVLLPVHQFVLKGSASNGNYVLRWDFISDEPVKNVILETSPDGITFHPLVALPSHIKSYSGVAAQAYHYYRLKAVTLSQGAHYYSNIINMISSSNRLPLRVITNPVRDEIIVSTSSTYHYKLFSAQGNLLFTGKFIAGINRVDVSNAANGILFLQVSTGAEKWTQVLIKQ